MIVLGLDPGFASFGWSALDVKSRSDIRVVKAGVIRTKKDTKKGTVRLASDNSRRARKLAYELDYLLAVHDPRFVCAEAFSAPRNASAAAKVGRAWGVIAGVFRGVSVFEVTPQEIKLALCSSRKASKNAVEAATKERVGAAFDAVPPGLERLAPGLRNHAYDAMAAVITCVDNPELWALMPN